MKPSVALFVLTLFCSGSLAYAQQPAGGAVERTAKRFRVGLQGGAGLDPEILDVGVHANIGPLFRPSITFRSGLEIGAGEVTTLLNLNFDVLYAFPGFTEETRWAPYVGAGPAFGLSHRGFGTDEVSHVDTGTGTSTTTTTTPNRFNFSDTDFNGGVNFVVGMRKPNGVFFEMKATAWGVSNIRLLAGFNF